LGGVLGGTQAWLLLRGCPVWFFAFTFGLSGLGFGCQPQAVGSSFLVPLLSALRGCSQFFMAGLVIGLICCGKRFWLVRAGFSRVLSGWRCWCFSRCAALRCSGLFRCGAKYVILNAQQVSQRDCPPFRLAKFVFIKGKRLCCRPSSGQPPYRNVIPHDQASLLKLNKKLQNSGG